MTVKTSNAPQSVWKRLRQKAQEGPEGNPAVRLLEMFKGYNASVGNALQELNEQPQDIVVRDEEIRMLYAVLERPRTPVALLLGHAGVGKTALVEEFAKQLNSGSYVTELDYTYMLVALRVGSLASIGVSKLQSTLASLLDKLHDIEKATQAVLNDPTIRIVLFIDEVHMIVTIFGPGTKIGGDVMKDVLARSPIRVIAATTRREYDSTIAVDKPLAERFKQIEMRELPPNIVKDIARNWWSKIAPDCVYPPDEVIDRMIDANRMYRSDSAEPRKSLDILEDLVSYSRRTGRSAGLEELFRIFRDRYSINLSFEVDADDVYAEVERRVKGQPHALYVMKRLLRSMVYQLDPTSNKPLMTALLTGPTGVGKTESVKAICSALYPNEPVMLNINMPDYKTAEHEAAFRKRLGEFVRHTPSAVVLLDEFEKAHESVRDSMLTILDEGLITFEVINREGMPEVNTISLRNTIVFATTNAGSEVFANDAKFASREAVGKDELNEVSKAEVEALSKSLVKYLQAAGFKPEMLGRFNRIIPYRGLSSDTLLVIAERALNEIKQKLLDTRDIELVYNEKRQWDKDVYNYYTNDLALYIAFIRAKADDPNSGGARAIKREIMSTMFDSVIDAIIDNPGRTRFKAYVSKDTAIYSYGAAASEGGIIVEPC